MLVYEIAHNDVSMTMKFVFVSMGLLFALLGNNMYNIKPNYFAGIRLPWTFESEDNWRKTHHLAGRFWFFGGLIFAVITFFINNTLIGYIAMSMLTILLLSQYFIHTTSINIQKKPGMKTKFIIYHINLIAYYFKRTGRLTGIWNGTLKVAGDLHLVLHISKSQNGLYEGTLDSPDQNVSGIKCDKVEVSTKSKHHNTQFHD